MVVTGSATEHSLYPGARGCCPPVAPSAAPEADDPSPPYPAFCACRPCRAHKHPRFMRCEAAPVKQFAMCI